MESTKTKVATEGKTQVCPFLALRHDPATALAFPSEHNFCYHSRPPQPARLEHQAVSCVTNNYPHCDEYNREQGNPLLSELRLTHNSRIGKKPGLIGLLILLFVFAMIILVGWQVLSRVLLEKSGGGKSPSATLSGLPVFIEMKPTQSTTPTHAASLPTPSLLVTATSILPVQTWTSMPGLPHALETPIGPGPKLIIHRVASGESIDAIANRYWTTVEAIHAINYHLPSPVLVDWLVIVPYNQTDVHGLPLFEAYKVETNVSVETLAQQFSKDLSLLKLYNGFGDGEILDAGDWVLIPHLAAVTP